MFLEQETEQKWLGGKEIIRYIKKKNQLQLFLNGSVKSPIGVSCGEEPTAFP